MLRRPLLPIIGLLLVAGTPSAAAHARVHSPAGDGVITRAEYIAGRLARDPVFISDQVPREIGPEDAARIRAAVGRMPVPTFLTVAPHVDGDPDRSEERLIALLHDRLGRDGVYVVTDETGIGLAALQYGGDLPVRAAATETGFALPYNAGVVRSVERFVDNVRSGRARERYDATYRRVQEGWEPEPFPDPPKPPDPRDVAAFAGAVSGAALTIGVIALALVHRRRAGGRPRGKAS
jgi:hypothetical protein